ncbi:MAG: hypothetical protein KF784_11375 [Fimbriimonadaceae bacterium]|nr:hypothetical protein [Fimbriimonadaceae bacterium]
MCKVRILLALLALVMVIGGCGQKEEKATLSASAGSADFPAAEWQDVSHSTFSMKLPTGWKILDLTSEEFDSMVKSMVDSNPNFKSVEPTIRQLKTQGQMKMMAFDVSTAHTGFTDNVNVIISPSPTPIKFDEIAKRNRDTMAAMLGTDAALDYSEVNLPAGKFARIKYSMPMNTPSGGQFMVQGMAFVTAKDNNEVVFTFSATDTSANAMEKAADKAMTSVKLK